ncbi:MAG: hydrogenase maturation protease [Terriglobia bacterium]|jgi:hydrogenase maturation protease
MKAASGCVCEATRDDEKTGLRSPGESPSPPPPILVLGLGNELLKDDAVGIRVAERLAAVFPDEVEVRSTALFGLALIDELVGRDKVLLIDSYVPENFGLSKIREIRLSAMVEAGAPSPHFVGLGEVIEIMRALEIGFPRQVRILAIPVLDPVTFSSEMSFEVQAHVGKAVQRASRIVWGWIAQEGNRRDTQRSGRT